MRQKIGKWRVGVVVLLLLAVYAKVAKSRLYDAQSKLSIFYTDDSALDHQY